MHAFSSPKEAVQDTSLQNMSSFTRATSRRGEYGYGIDNVDSCTDSILLSVRSHQLHLVGGTNKL